MNLVALNKLKGYKNLLAFSYGTDSTALFYALLNECDFDIAIVNYNTRKSSLEECTNAQKLATKYNKLCFVKDVKLNESNFEANARKTRYEFFDTLMKDYDNLIIAHNLNDKLEWFLMQLAKGSGLCNMLSMSECDNMNNYKIIRPLINTPKEEILNYLKTNNIFHYNDSTNYERIHLRNIFRFDYANDFVKKHSNGLIKSFKYLEIDKNNLLDEIHHFKDLYYTKSINSLDKIIKQFGILTSFKQKEELLKCIKAKNEAQIYSNNKRLEIAFYKDFYFAFLNVKTTLSKTEKEDFRKAKVPNNLRFFLSINKIKLDDFLDQLNANFN